MHCAAAAGAQHPVGVGEQVGAAGQSGQRVPTGGVQLAAHGEVVGERGQDEGTAAAAMTRLRVGCRKASVAGMMGPPFSPVRGRKKGEAHPELLQV